MPGMRIKSVSFGDMREQVYDNRLSQEEKSACFYSSAHFQEMKGQAYGLAKTAMLLGNNDVEVERLYRGQDTLRGLEKQLTAQKVTAKRKHNIIRSIVELHQLQKCCDADDQSERSYSSCPELQSQPPSPNYPNVDKKRAREIKVVLEKYVQKHRERALKAARERALGDEEAALSIYGDYGIGSTLEAALQLRGGLPERRRSVA